jgi:hypothetical protein
MVGGGSTVTPNVHDPVRCRVSVAVHVTVVDPNGKSASLAGVQDVVIGGAPPITVAVP